jgi:ABC-type glycerol-3-phosphate transport system substrate-binding protein
MRGVRGVRVAALLVALGLAVAACGGGDDEGGDAGTGGVPGGRPPWSRRRTACPR